MPSIGRRTDRGLPGYRDGHGAQVDSDTFVLDGEDLVPVVDDTGKVVAIEANPGDRATLDAIFRTIHNLKGTSGFFSLPKLGAIAHAGESLLVRLRDGSIA